MKGLLNLKNKTKNNLEVEPDLRCNLSEIQSDIDKLVRIIQIHNI